MKDRKVIKRVIKGIIKIIFLSKYKNKKRVNWSDISDTSE